ncbi:MAG: 2-C-methyl-D-erythritol 4-phosphate cytidylyltransferase [Desulfobacula sp.]|nr:2-C-methyl-D-erythritol 4-phosphate cytidylyltransferase [Desulfobacula sp.]
MDYQNYVIIVAAGIGLRMGSTIKKQYLCLDKIPILAHTVKVFDKCDYINEMILVVSEKDKDYCQTNIIAPFEFKKNIHLVQGGKTRQDSVFNGLKYLQECVDSAKKTIVMIHDGVRPFVDDTIIINCINGAIKHGCSIPAVKITDTIKQVDQDFCVQKTLNREMVYCAQTPQAFKMDLILNAFGHAVKNNFSGTDDASIIENAGHKVYIVEGSKHNIKITTPEDLVLGKYLLTLKSS